MINEHLKESLWGLWIAKDQKAVQGKDERIFSLWMQERCWDYEDESPLVLTERDGCLLYTSRCV